MNLSAFYNYRLIIGSYRTISAHLLSDFIYNCWDNAVAESFFKTMKTEMVYHTKFKTRREASMAIFEYIEIWYNRKRSHSTLGFLSPVEFENELINKEEMA